MAAQRHGKFDRIFYRDGYQHTVLCWLTRAEPKAKPEISAKQGANGYWQSTSSYSLNSKPKNPYPGATRSMDRDFRRTAGCQPIQGRKSHRWRAKRSLTVTTLDFLVQPRLHVAAKAPVRCTAHHYKRLGIGIGQQFVVLAGRLFTWLSGQKKAGSHSITCLHRAVEHATHGHRLICTKMRRCRSRRTTETQRSNANPFRS